MNDLPRRRFLMAGGAAVVVGATGCTSGRGRSPVPATTTSTTVVGDTTADVRLLRTASSLEHYMVGVYMEAAGLNLLKSSAALDIVKAFADDHSQHAGAFEGATGRIGGQPFTEANPVLSRTIAPRIAALRSETDVLRLAYELERAAAATYFSATGGFAVRAMNATVMGVCAVEARHLAVLGSVLAAAGSTDTPPFPPSGFMGTEGAVTPGLGV